MAARASKLASLDEKARKELEGRLLGRQESLCFICQELMDLVLHDLDVEHIVPLASKGPDEENNFALVHLRCNRSKGASDGKCRNGGIQRKRRQLAEGYLTGQQLADRLGIGRTTLGRWLRAGKLKPTKSIGGMRLFRREDRLSGH